MDPQEIHCSIAPTLQNTRQGGSLAFVFKNACQVCQGQPLNFVFVDKFMSFKNSNATWTSRIGRNKRLKNHESISKAIFKCSTSHRICCRLICLNGQGFWPWMWGQYCPAAAAQRCTNLHETKFTTIHTRFCYFTVDETVSAAMKKTFSSNMIGFLCAQQAWHASKMSVWTYYTSFPASRTW